MYQNPKRAKKLYSDVVPKAVDEYLSFIEKYKTQDTLQKLLNPVWHVHNSRPPKENFIMPFSVLLNLVGTSNAHTKEVLWKFVKKNKKNINVKEYPIFDKLVEYLIINVYHTTKNARMCNILINVCARCYGSHVHYELFIQV